MKSSASDRLQPHRQAHFSTEIIQLCTFTIAESTHLRTVQIGGYARASYASGGGGASRMPRIAGEVAAGSALVSCVLVSYAPCAERRRL